MSQFFYLGHCRVLSIPVNVLQYGKFWNSPYLSIAKWDCLHGFEWMMAVGSKCQFSGFSNCRWRLVSQILDVVIDIYVCRSNWRRLSSLSVACVRVLVAIDRASVCNRKCNFVSCGYGAKQKSFDCLWREGAAMEEIGPVPKPVNIRYPRQKKDMAHLMEALDRMHLTSLIKIPWQDMKVRARYEGPSK